MTGCQALLHGFRAMQGCRGGRQERSQFQRFHGTKGDSLVEAMQAFID
jgi:hypothetical protein